MSYARPAQPGGTAGRDPAGESTLPADVAGGRPGPTNGPGAGGTRAKSSGRPGGPSARTTGVGALGAAVGTTRAGGASYGASARAAALRAAQGEHEPVSDTDWERIGTLGLGIVIGAVIGAGAALLLAPQSGAETREFLARGARDLRSSAGDSWSDLGEELRTAARRRRRQLRRGVTRGRWAVADLVDE